VAKITRQTLSVFGINAGGSDIGVFGSLEAGSPTYSNIISTIQGLAAWSTGWAAETIATWRPALEDMNAVHYVLSYGICYLHEMGIAEYDSATTYYTNSICQNAGIIYQSLVDNNTGNTPAIASSYWRQYSAVPSGIIVMWYGSIATIPSGWVLCDGSNGTIDMRDLFVVGAGGAYAAGATLGAATHTHMQGSLVVPDIRAGSARGASVPYATETYPVDDNSGGSDSDNHRLQNVPISGATASGSSLPPAYAIVFIMKS
jgi:hypothetical protein